MKLCLIRHSLAADPAPNKLDQDRELTAAGVERARRLGQALNQLKLVPRDLYTSPFVRAVQTAVILSAEIAGAPAPIQLNELEAEVDLVESLKTHLQPRLNDSDLIVVVGHQPSIGYLTQNLLGVPRDLVRVSPATAVLLELNEWRRGAAEIRVVISGEELG